MQSLCGVLTVPDVFAGLLKSFTTLCVRVRASNTSVWLSSTSGPSARDFVPLVGEFGITDAFAGILEPFTSPCAFPAHVRLVRVARVCPVGQAHLCVPGR